MDHYATLGVPPSADAARVREAYKRAALRAHPDRGTGDARAFLELKRAYDCLADATARKRYDAALASRRARPLAETIDAEELDAVCAPIGREDAGGASGGVDAYARACRCGDAYEIPAAELHRLRRELHDECVLECGGCSLRIGVRLRPIGADAAHASGRVTRA